MRKWNITFQQEPPTCACDTQTRTTTGKKRSLLGRLDRELPRSARVPSPISHAGFRSPGSDRPTPILPSGPVCPTVVPTTESFQVKPAELLRTGMKTPQQSRARGHGRQNSVRSLKAKKESFLKLLPAVALHRRWQGSSGLVVRSDIQHRRPNLMPHEGWRDVQGLGGGQQSAGLGAYLQIYTHTHTRAPAELPLLLCHLEQTFSLLSDSSPQ